MASSRQIICMTPVEAMVGKLARSKDKVSSKNPGFKAFVGFQRSYAVTNRFALKVRPRSAGYTEEELKLQTKFKQAVTNARKAMLDPVQLPTLQKEYKESPTHKTFYGFVFAKEYAKLNA